MKIIELLVGACISFGRNIIGIVFRPYESYRRIADHGSLIELIYIGFVLAFYFGLASLVHTSQFRPFLLTKEFVLLAGGAFFTYILVVGLVWNIGVLAGGKGTLRAVLLGWGYTLIPTVFWFLVTSLLYVILPPPRTTSVAGVSFSVLFLVFSTVLFFWKVILAYLTMRFGLRLDLGRIVIVTLITVPILVFYSMLMYRWGIFRVPFL
ncbi:hypothetical protein A2875_04890 [Candidatus Gottesmanbacteria bacterium RIFCSPHIGHO2_01_FULL_46_14]|uniref:Yip1 domain-containing protein n=3 Tax=Candidatus Gottesmaniibacteriota TaxID=1752720 RepID=A0A1F5ZP34_9BACT|nr:MAG: hypothetical protein UY08_C0010G0006 [Candidatus Gottesmanbacteria bacterium GW2011_GWA1_47_8]OGG14198.1 MAG: hypothetical protein A2875_04890 [Candidatus Gottesmanbacteria bacterium RIFCSPHIGHO2_01_FULL_46_14]OGG29443.1 MAG: hypothetical protein A2971_02640 [Candidatus Gottesmanbacteria bacterium RIFCSPLOWO2_01_FULL_46_21]